MKKAHDILKEGKLYFIVELEYDVDTGEAKVLGKRKLTDSKASAIHKSKEIAVKNVMGQIK